MTSKKLHFVILTVLIILSGFINTSCSDCKDYEDDGIASLSTSIFVATDRHDNGNGNNLKDVLRSVVTDADAVTPSLVLIGGDFVGDGSKKIDQPVPSDSILQDSIGQTSDGQSTADKTTQEPQKEADPEFSINDVELEIDSVMGGHQCQRFFTYGSHDIECEDGYAPFFSGPYEADGYYVYGISYAQMIYDELPDSTYTGIDADDIHGCCAREAAKYFEGWVSAINDNKPIIIMSHVPMHHRRKDNAGGERWYRAISNAATKHDILLLFGHNHTVEEQGDSISEREEYLLVPGDSITVQGNVKSNGMEIISEEEYSHVLNFYYGNAGYLKQGYGSLITFRRSKTVDRWEEMTIKRYSILNPVPSVIGETDKPNPYTVKLIY